MTERTGQIFDFETHEQRGVTAYLEKHSFYDDLATVVRRIIEESLKRRGISVHSVQARAKDPTNFGRKGGWMVLVQHRDIDDPETGGGYTVKRYESEKKSDGTGGWRRAEIRLLPENPDFAPIILRDVRDDEFHVIAEALEVLGVA